MLADEGFLVAHLSDLHLRDAGDVAALDHQLGAIASRSPAHLVVTGDLLDHWDRSLLRRTLAVFDSHGFNHADKLTIIHGNHDLASSGGHPRTRRDLWRLGLRFWDPPPLLQARRRTFYEELDRWTPGVARQAPYTKVTTSGLRIATLDSVPLLWRPLRLNGRHVTVQHGVGCIRPTELAALPRPDARPLILLIHHYPEAVEAFSWQPDGWLSGVVRQVDVPMAIPPEDREALWQAAVAAGTRLVLCGHVHRARLEWHEGIALGLNGQSGADWAGRTIAYYHLTEERISASLVSGDAQKR